MDPPGSKKCDTERVRECVDTRRWTGTLEFSKNCAIRERSRDEEKKEEESAAEGEGTYRRRRLPRRGSGKGSCLWTDIIVDAVDGHPRRVPEVGLGGEDEQGLVLGRGVVNCGLVSAGLHRRGFEDCRESER
jgi:hypothetical protein